MGSEEHKQVQEKSRAILNKSKLRDEQDSSKLLKAKDLSK